jgi:multidrug transporter EmrE-like cation transporter
MSWLQRNSFLLLYILFTVASQIIMRWRVGSSSDATTDAMSRLQFVLSMLLTPWVWGAILCTFLAGVAWMLALTRFELTYAFPFTGVSFVLILFAGAFLFGEHVSLARIAGTMLVVLGLIVVVRS